MITWQKCQGFLGTFGMSEVPLAAPSIQRDEEKGEAEDQNLPQ